MILKVSNDTISCEFSSLCQAKPSILRQFSKTVLLNYHLAFSLDVHWTILSTSSNILAAFKAEVALSFLPA